MSPVLDLRDDCFTLNNPEPTSQDKLFLNKCTSLVGLARNALEEAEQYAQGIQDPILKAKALSLLTNV